MSHSEKIELWKSEAEAISDPKPIGLPLDVLVGESVEVAKFLRKYWEAGQRRPGLSSAGPKLSPEVADEILSVRDAVQDAQTEYLLIIEDKVPTKDLMAQGNKQLGEITGVLEWHLDDGVNDDADTRLSQLKEAHSDDTSSADSLAQALHDYATLAKPLAGELDGLGNFNAATIDEAFETADRLGEVQPGGTPRSEAATDAIFLRNQLANLLKGRMRLVRSAARFVFRDHPEIVREVTSAYERKRRAAARRESDVPPPTGNPA